MESILISSYGLSDFIKEIESTYDAGRPETIWACEATIKKLLDHNLIQSFVNQQLTALVDDPATDGNWRAHEFTIHHGNRWSTSVALFDTRRRYIHVLASLAIYVPLSGALKVERYGLPDSYQNAVFDPGVRVEHLGNTVIQRGELLQLDTRKHAYYFDVDQPVAVLRVETAPIRPLEWLFSRQTLLAWQANDAALSFTQLRVAAYALGKIAHQSSIAPLRELTRHPHHAVRWAAIQNLGRLNRSEALIKIREAVNDPHPHVRRAAQRTLDKMQPKAN